MTLRDLWLIIRHYFKSIIVVSLVCAIFVSCGSVFLNTVKGSGHMAISKLTITDPTGLVGATSLVNFADVVAQDEIASEDFDDIEAKTEPDYAAQSVEFTIKASSPELAVDTANSLAERTKESMEAALVRQGDDFLKEVNEAESLSDTKVDSVIASGATAADRVGALRSVSYVVTEALPPKETGIVGLLVYGVVGLLGGFCVMLFGLALYDAARRPIKTKADVLEATDLHVLSTGRSARSVEFLLTNLAFVAGDKPLETVCVFPVSGKGDPEIQALLNDESVRTSSSFEASTVFACCDSSKESVAAVKRAHDSDATVLVARVWKDSVADVENALEELRLAKADVVGIALI